MNVDRNKAVWKSRMVWKSFREEWSSIETNLERRIFKLVGDELQPGILKLAKVYVAQKRRVSMEMFGRRHGNKGIVATIVPEEGLLWKTVHQLILSLIHWVCPHE